MVFTHLPHPFRFIRGESIAVFFLFVRYYAGLWRHQGQWLPLPKAGKDIWKQPVFVSDVAHGIVNAVRDPEAVGKTYEAVG